MFKYNGFKLFLLKILLGIFFVGLSFFLFISIATYSPSDPGIGKINGNKEIINFFGFWGSISSSLLLTIFGRMSLALIAFVLYTGLLSFLGIRLERIFLKFLVIIFSVIFFNFSLLLLQIHIFELGLISNVFFDIFVFYFPSISFIIFFELPYSKCITNYIINYV